MSAKSAKKKDGDGDPTSMLTYKKSNGSRDVLAKDILEEQLDDVSQDKKLMYKDIKRICKNIDRSIFDGNKCCMWLGHVTNLNNLNKGRYVNFYFRKRKVALHRLLYVNFVGDLTDDEYLKFNCDNKGICCNVKHLKKFKYQKIPEKKESGRSSSNKRKSKRVIVVSSHVKDEDWEKYKHKLVLNFS
jgi:hypothetical protein